jgi:hypothetical protein
MWVDQWFITLNVYDERELLCLACYFGDPIRPALVSSRGQGDFRAPIEGSLCDSHVVGGDDYRVESFCFSASFPNVL